MATPRAKRNTTTNPHPVDSTTRACCGGIGTHSRDCKTEASPAELAPVELDPPNPAIARWEELSGRDIAIDHGGDAQKVLPYPRPAWAHPDCDQVGTSVSLTSFNSDSAYIPANHMGGEAIGETVMPCGFRVRGRFIGDGWGGVGISMTRYLSDAWRELGITLTLDEARDLANAILAAIDMVGGDQ